jgi:membrane-anchored protein YejM (alkaline phosphatase superfamily)
VPRNPSFTWELGKSAFLGGRFESFKTGDPNDAHFRVQDLSALNVQVDRRQSLRQSIDNLARQIDFDDQLKTLDEFQKRAMDLVLSPEARRAFDIQREDPRLRDRYGRTTTGQSCLLARRLVESGVRFVTINSGGWDHHSTIFQSLDRRLPELDHCLSALIEDLESRGLLQSTLVLCMGEFGRTPKINNMAGRDHWGHVASLIFAGGGVQPGRVIGSSDDQGAYITDRPVRPADVAATIYQAVGVDPSHNLLTPENRPVAILDEGTAISELFA